MSGRSISLFLTVSVNFIFSMLHYISQRNNPASSYMFKVNNRNTGTRCEICSKLTIKTPKRRYWRRFGVFIVNFKHISHLVLVFLLLILSRKMPAGKQHSESDNMVEYYISMQINFFEKY